MPSAMRWVAFAALSAYLLLFAAGSLRLAEGGQRVWLFGAARGPDRLAAIGFRAVFGLAFVGPLLWMAVPWRHKANPLWAERGAFCRGGCNRRGPGLGRCGVGAGASGTIPHGHLLEDWR